MIITTNQRFRRRIVTESQKVTVNYNEITPNQRMRELKTEWCAKRIELGLPIYKEIKKFYRSDIPYNELSVDDYSKHEKRISEEQYNAWKDITAFNGNLRIVVKKINMFNLK
jgi:hypothetical protein